METTVVKALKVLENLVSSESSQSLTEIAGQCGLSKSNAHRLLGTLEACGYVRRSASSRNYELTLRLWELGQRVYSQVDLRAVAAPYLRKLALETEETVNLSVLDDNRVLYLDKVDSIHAVRTSVSAGDRAPAYCTATGKAMLAHSPAELVSQIGATIETFTPNTVRSLDELRRQLEEIRDRGYSVTHGEWRRGVLGYGVPIKSLSGRVLGAIGVAGPEDRLRQSDEGRFTAALQATAQEIERELGFSETTAQAENLHIAHNDAPGKTKSAPRANG